MVVEKTMDQTGKAVPVIMIMLMGRYMQAQIFQK